MDNYDYKQLIIARKDLGMSPGKLAVQVAHASMAFLTAEIRRNTFRIPKTGFYASSILPSDKSNDPIIDIMIQKAKENGESTIYYYRHPLYKSGITRPYDVETIPLTKKEYDSNYVYRAEFSIDPELYEGWIDGSFTKVLCEAKNRNQLEKAISYAKELGLVEGKDFFLIKDNCLTELTPEEPDSSLPTGGHTLTCIGFRPLPAQIQREISRHFQLWRNPEKQEEREVAHWEFRDSQWADGGKIATCSECKNSITILGRPLSYCPYCGRKMEEKEAD